MQDVEFFLEWCGLCGPICPALQTSITRPGDAKGKSGNGHALSRMPDCRVRYFEEIIGQPIRQP